MRAANFNDFGCWRDFCPACFDLSKPQQWQRFGDKQQDATGIMIRDIATATIRKRCRESGLIRWKIPAVDEPVNRAVNEPVFIDKPSRHVVEKLQPVERIPLA